MDTKLTDEDLAIPPLRTTGPCRLGATVGPCCDSPYGTNCGLQCASHFRNRDPTPEFMKVVFDINESGHHVTQQEEASEILARAMFKRHVQPSPMDPVLPPPLQDLFDKQKRLAADFGHVDLTTNSINDYDTFKIAMQMPAREFVRSVRQSSNERPSFLWGGLSRSRGSTAGLKRKKPPLASDETVDMHMPSGGSSRRRGSAAGLKTTEPPFPSDETVDMHMPSHSGKTQTFGSRREQNDAAAQHPKTTSCGKTTKIHWKSVNSMRFETKLLAKAWMEQPDHPVLRHKGSKRNTTANVHLYKCKNDATGHPRCRAQMSVFSQTQSDGMQVQVKLRIDENCNCPTNKTEPKRIVPTEAARLVTELLGSDPLAPAQPSMVASQVVSKLETNKHFTDVTNNAGLCTALKKQIKDLITRKKKTARTSRCDSAADLKCIRDKCHFALPSSPLSLPDDDKPSCETMLRVSKQLFREGHLRVNAEVLSDNHSVEDSAHQLLTFLDGTRDTSEHDSSLSHAERKLYERIQELSEKDVGVGSPWVKSVCFSSFAMLWNLKQCEQLDFKVTASSDGTHNIAASEHVLLNFGCFDVKPKLGSVRSFRPFIYIICPTESELYYSICVVTFLKYVRRLFGLRDLHFKGMLVSDRTNVFVNTWKIAFPTSITAQCFPHLIRKFKCGISKGKGCGAYRKFYNAEAGCHKTMPASAELDVHFLEMCLTKAMFLKMWELVKSSWDAEGGMEAIKKRFCESYVNGDSFNNWFIGASGIICCYPDNNPNERNSLSIKGTAQMAGLCEVGKELGHMLEFEFPKAVRTMSRESVVGRELLINRDNELGCPTSKTYRWACNYAKHVCPALDVHRVELGDGSDCYYLNTFFSLSDFPKDFLKLVNASGEDDIRLSPPGRLEGVEGVESQQQCKRWDGWLSEVETEDHRYVSTERIFLYESCVNGETLFGPEQRKFFMRSVCSLCKVMIRRGNGVSGYSGSCSTFLKHGYCAHAAYVRNKKTLEGLNVKIDGSKKASTHAKRKKHLAKLHHHLKRSLVYLDKTRVKLCVPVGLSWRERGDEVSRLSRRVEHLMMFVDHRSVSFDAEHFPSNKMARMEKSAEEVLILYRHSIELSIVASKLSDGRRTRRNNQNICMTHETPFLCHLKVVLRTCAVIEKLVSVPALANS